MSIGVGVDANDHVWIVHRPDSVNANEAAEDAKTGTCCAKAPPILEFDQQGTLLRHWGGSDGDGYQWPASNHGVTIDHKGNVWIGGNGGGDGMVLKFTQDGKFLMHDRQEGRADRQQQHRSTSAWSPRSSSTRRRTRPTSPTATATSASSCIDADTGKFKRYWGAYGNKPDDTNLGRYNPDAPPAQQFRTPVHCAEMSNDRLRLRLRPRQRSHPGVHAGRQVRQGSVGLRRRTLGDGSTWDIAFSNDPQQKFIYLADGHDEKVWILDRQSLEILTSFGDGGKMPGQFYAVHSIATDSKGNIYTTETYVDGRRLQRFLYKGMQTVTKGEDQGTCLGRRERRQSRRRTKATT